MSENNNNENNVAVYSSDEEEKEKAPPKTNHQAHCFRCKKKVHAHDQTVEHTANKRCRVKGVCPDCSCKVSSFIKKEILKN